jgi:AraC-like DNA-binding protein
VHRRLVKSGPSVFPAAYTGAVSEATSAFRVYRPSRPLAPFVGFLWSCDRYVVSHTSERVLPTGTADVIFRGDDYRNLRGGLAGPRSKYVTVSTERPFTAVGIHFKPGGAYPFLGGATVDLADDSAPLVDLWGSAADELSERLACVAAPEDRFRVLEQSLLTRLPGGFVPRQPIRRALDLFQRSGGRMSVGAVVQRIGISRRRFVDAFRTEVGLSPKVFCRLRRFSAVLDDVASLNNADWADVAQAVGYWDQAHFNHEFREFCGLTPSEYLARRIAPTHVAAPGS